MRLSILCVAAFLLEPPSFSIGWRNTDLVDVYTYFKLLFAGNLIILDMKQEKRDIGQVKEYIE